MKLSIKGCFYAKKCHKETNHKYDGMPYEYHLKMCSDVGEKFIGYIKNEDMERVFAAIWCHDVIEDCRQTYNDVKTELGSIVADIVYACTNEKGKNRKERANDKYYKGIKDTQYAVFVKLCDRIANFEHSIVSRSRMAEMYAKENADFISKIYTEGYDEMFDYLYRLEKEVKLMHPQTNQL